jgi:hypothetical protein
MHGGRPQVLPARIGLRAQCRKQARHIYRVKHDVRVLQIHQRLQILFARFVQIDWMAMEHIGKINDIVVIQMAIVILFGNFFQSLLLLVFNVGWRILLSERFMRKQESGYDNKNKDYVIAKDAREKCESATKQSPRIGDCFVAVLLAMTVSF